MKSDDLYTLFIQILMAAAGAIARILSQKEKQAIKLLTVLSEIFIAGFTSLIIYWIAESAEINRGYMYALAGIAGWVGPKLLNTLASVIAGKSGINLKGDDAGG